MSKPSVDELQADRRLEVLATRTSIVVWHSRVDGSIGQANPSWAAFTGQSFERYSGWGWLEAIHPGDRDAVETSWRSAARARVPFEAEYRLKRHDGEYRLMQVEGTPVLSAGQVAEWVGVCIDVSASRASETALRQSELRLRFLDVLGLATRSLTDPAEVMQISARMLGEYLGATRCAYADVEPDGDRFTIRNDWSGEGVASSAGVYSLELFGAKATSRLRRGDNLVVRNVDLELGDDGGARMFNAIGIKAIICEPLVKDGRLVAMMAVHQAQPRDWKPQEIELVAEVVDRCWIHIEWVRDVAERERALLKLEIGIQAADLVMAEIDYRTGLNHLSAELARLLELSDGPVTVPRQAIFDRIHPDDRERYLQAIGRTIDPSGDGLLAIDVRALLPSGTERWMHIRLKVTFSMLDGRMQPERGICAAREVTTEVQARRQMQEADRRKDEFIATLAHELRNPLAPIRNGLEILKRSAGMPASAIRIRDMMERQLVHMVRLVDDLLDVSRITRDKLEVRLAPVTVKEIVDLAVEATRPFIDAAGHTLAIDLPPQTVHVNGDLTRLAQVVSNLLNNAAKYTQGAGHIELSAHVQAGELVLSVVDDGAGIAAPMLGHVFDLFSQVRDAQRHAQGGLGIGLWLVKKLVELHGGTIEARSQGVGSGSAFIVRLPVLPAQSAQI